MIGCGVSLKRPLFADFAPFGTICCCFRDEDLWGLCDAADVAFGDEPSAPGSGG